MSEQENNGNAPAKETDTINDGTATGGGGRSKTPENGSFAQSRQNSSIAGRRSPALYRRNVSSLIRLRQSVSPGGTAIEMGSRSEGTATGSVPSSPVAVPRRPADHPPRSPPGTVRRRNTSMVPRKRKTPAPAIAVTEPIAEPTEVAPKPAPELPPPSEVVTVKVEGEAAAPPVKQRPGWHAMPEEEFYAKVDSRPGGLTTEEAQARLAKFGRNELAPPEQIPIYVRFFHNYFSPFSLMLQAAGVLSFIIVGINSGTGGELDVQTLALAIVLFVVALVTAVFQTSQEAAADNLVEALHELSADFAWVYRDGNLQKLNAAELVQGDQLRVLSGEKVPADVRIMSANDLKVNNAPLTGENNDIKLGKEPKHHDVFEAKNIAWSGCNFTSGTGVAIVFETGERTYFGEIAKATTTAEKPDTLMRREVRRLILIMAIVGFIIAAAFFAASLGTGQRWQDAVIIFIGLFVANIPEGLLPQITIALTITAKKMQDCKVVVSNLEIIETLGAVSVICSDKTGTLTTNRMTVSHIVYHGEIHIAPWSAVLPDDTFPLIDSSCPTLQGMMQVGALCSDATFVSKEGEDVNSWLIKGDATESGLMRFIQPSLDVEKTRAEFKRLAYVPFHSERKWMASVNAIHNHPTLVFKGAAERVLARCATAIIDDNGSEVPVTDEMIEHYHHVISQLASRGERVIGFARLPLRYPVDYEWNADGEESNFPLDDLILLGFVSLADPPRVSVKPAVAACHKAGIKVIMVTGDHPETATAISRSLGIITRPLLSEAPPEADPTEFAAVVTGEDILTMSEHDWDRVLLCKEQIFARTQPEQKQALVYHLQHHGHIVAMTGDGVNDAPALKAANVGVAMGSGTSVAKEAAQIVISNDDFGALVIGIKDGRQIFENLKKAVTYIVTHLAPAVWPHIFVLILGIPLSMETIVILLVDLGTDMLPGISLAYEEAEERIMSLPPRSKDSHLISPKMIIMGYLLYGWLLTFFAFWGFFWTLYDHGYTYNTVKGMPTTYRSAYKDLTREDQIKFSGLCASNQQYIREHGGNVTAVCRTFNGMTHFMEDYSDTVSKAQAAYFIMVASMQFANIVVRRQQTMSAFSPHQVLNIRCAGAILFSIGFMCFFVYVPKVNKAFFLSAVSTADACAALWGVLVLILIDETRKFFCRLWPGGLVSKLTVY